MSGRIERACPILMKKGPSEVRASLSLAAWALCLSGDDLVASPEMNPKITGEQVEAMVKRRLAAAAGRASKKLERYWASYEVGRSHLSPEAVVSSIFVESLAKSWELRLVALMALSMFLCSGVRFSVMVEGMEVGGNMDLRAGLVRVLVGVEEREEVVEKVRDGTEGQRKPGRRSGETGERRRSEDKRRRRSLQWGVKVAIVGDVEERGSLEDTKRCVSKFFFAKK